jgi:hypothetical protein
MREKRTKRAANDYWACDCETDPFKHGRVPEPFIWGAYNPHLQEYHEFDTVEEFIAFTQERGGIYYAHNGGKFDWYFIIQYIDLMRPVKVINGRLAKFYIGEAEFRDSYSILPVPLSAYKKVEFDYRKLERDVRAKHMPEIKHYLYTDCVYLSDLISVFRTDHGNKLTLAGAAMADYEARSGIDTDNTNAEYYAEFYSYYAGGRVESFARGEVSGPLSVIDINSAYPFAMLNRHACGTSYTSVNSLDNLTRDEIARAFITCRAVSTGAFFYRDETGLKFPSDGATRQFHVTGWEYLAALDTGTLQGFELIEARVFNNSRDFAPYVNHWYSKRLEDKRAGRDADQLIDKLFLNSLYGKFGTDAGKYKDYEIIESKFQFHAMTERGGDWHLEHMFNGRSLMSRPASEAARRYYNVATAASVTGYVRAMLWRALNKCRAVSYCDTDSIIAGDITALELDPDTLGAWKLEAEAVKGYFAGKKLYAVELVTPDKHGNKFKTASKGVRLSAADIIEVAKGAEITWNNDAPTFRFTNNVIYDKLVDRYHSREIAFQSRKVKLT